jgi:hypothetical protein
VHINFPPIPTEISILCHQAKTDDIFLPGGRVGPSPFTKIRKVEIFVLETLILHFGFELPSNIFRTMYLYWGQTIIVNYYGIKYSLYIAIVAFRDLIDNFKKEKTKTSLTKRVERRTSVPTWGIQSYKAGIEGSACRGAYVLLSGGMIVSEMSGVLKHLQLTLISNINLNLRPWFVANTQIEKLKFTREEITSLQLLVLTTTF